MQRCLIQGCGRQFQNQLTMLEHVKRRHPSQSDQIKQKTTNQMLQKQERITEEMNKLPRMQKIIQMSKQKKPLQFQRRSASKKRKQPVNIVQSSQIKLNDIITQSRKLVDQNANTKRLVKRPSLLKKPAGQSDTKLPSLNQTKVRKLKLQALKSQFNSTLINQSPSTKFMARNDLKAQKAVQSQMYSTAPNFTQQMTRKIHSIKSRSKGKKQQGQVSNQQDLTKIQTKELMHKKTLSSRNMQSLVQSDQQLLQNNQPIQRPIKKLLQRNIKKNKDRISLTTQLLSESTYMQKPKQLVSANVKQLAFPSGSNNKSALQKDLIHSKFTKKQKHPKIQIKKSQKQHQQPNWQQRTVTLRDKDIQHFSIPYDAEVEYLFAINCQIKQIDLNECFSLVQLSLNNNKITGFNFLTETLNGAYENLEAIYLDHNLITSLTTLPVYLQLERISLSFNQVSGLDQTLKVLAKFPFLQELDFSFNPIRKQPNYKLAILSACKSLKKLDGMVITKFDRELAAQYHKMYYQYLNVIPLSSSNNSKEEYRPSTAVSINYQQQLQSQNLIAEMTEEELQRQIQSLQKMIKSTKQQFQIIQEQNSTLDEQISTFQTALSNQCKQDSYNPKLYKKLCIQVQELQMLNFLQYASESELQDLLLKKARQKGIGLQIITVN